MGDSDGIELPEGQDFPQRSDGINRGNGGGGKASLLVIEARRFESQQIIDGDVVVPAACKKVKVLFIPVLHVFQDMDAFRNPVVNLPHPQEKH